MSQFLKRRGKKYFYICTHISSVSLENPDEYNGGGGSGNQRSEHIFEEETTGLTKRNKL